MCLAIPATVVVRNGSTGTIDLQGNRLPIDLSLVPEAQPGDCVLVHAGFAIQTLTALDAKQSRDAVHRIMEGDGR